MLPRTQSASDAPAPVNLFIAGLPLRCSVAEIRTILAHVTVETVEPHVGVTQGSFAFLRVPQEQVTEACEKYDGVRLQEKFLHVSRIRAHPVGCRKCWQLGHRAEECTLSLGDVQKVPQTLNIQRTVALPPAGLPQDSLKKQHDNLERPRSPEQPQQGSPPPGSEQRLQSPPLPSPQQLEAPHPNPDPPFHSPPHPNPPFQCPPLLSPEQRFQTPPQPLPTLEQRFQSPPQPIPEQQSAPLPSPEKRLPSPPPFQSPEKRPQQVAEVPSNHLEAAASILFAQAWVGEIENDEWPCAEASRQEPLPELPQKRKQSEEARAEENTWKLAQAFVAKASLTKTEQSKELVRQLRESGSAPCGDAKFLLEKQKGAVNLCSRVTCAKCKASIMVKSVLAHLMSKSHQAAAQS